MRTGLLISRVRRRQLTLRPKRKPEPKVFTSAREVLEHYGVRLPEEGPGSWIVILPRGRR